MGNIQPDGCHHYDVPQCGALQWCFCWWDLSPCSYLVGGLEHFLFSHISGIIIPIDFHIFQRGSNHQPDVVINITNHSEIGAIVSPTFWDLVYNPHELLSFTGLFPPAVSWFINPLSRYIYIYLPWIINHREIGVMFTNLAKELGQHRKCSVPETVATSNSSLHCQVLGQAFGIPVPFVLTLFIGMWLAGATTVAYGKAEGWIIDVNTICFAMCMYHI